MKKNNRCLICAEPMEGGMDYHKACSRRFFGKPVPPELPYVMDELSELAKNIVRRSVTVPGVQNKLSLHLEKTGKGGGRLTLVGLWGAYILKPPSDKYPRLPENEDTTMRLASHFRIHTVPHGLIRLKSGELAYITRRIDRADGFKIHMEDFCQISGRLTEDKYKGSIEQLGKLIRRHSSNPGLDVLRFFELSVFSYLTGNADMHLKNFSLIYDPAGLLTLSPAYDLLSTRLVLSEKEDPDETALTINGKKSRLNRNDFESFAAAVGLEEKQVNAVWKNFRKRIGDSRAVIQNGWLDPVSKKAYISLIKKRSEILL